MKTLFSVFLETYCDLVLIFCSCLAGSCANTIMFDKLEVWFRDPMNCPSCWKLVIQFGSSQPATFPRSPIRKLVFQKLKLLYHHRTQRNIISCTGSPVDSCVLAIPNQWNVKTSFGSKRSLSKRLSGARTHPSCW